MFQVAVMNFRLYPRRWLVVSLSLLSLCLAIVIHPATATQPVPAPPVVSAATTSPLAQGRQLYQAGRFVEAIAIWQQAEQQYRLAGDRLNQALTLSYLSLAQQDLTQWDAAQDSISQSRKLLNGAQPDAFLWAQVLNAQASLLLHTGKPEPALTTWQQAQKYYDQAGDRAGSIGSQINQAQALQTLGYYRRARQQLEALNQTLAALPNSAVKVSGLRTLGAALQVVGDIDNSQAVLLKSLDIARQINAQTDLHPILLSLGKIATDSGDPNAALDYFQQAEQATTSPLEQLQARLDRLHLLMDHGQTDQAAELAIALAAQIRQQFVELPASRTALYGAINFVAQINQLEDPAVILPLKDLAELMSRTVQAARQLQDAPAEAHALNQWGQLYGRTRQWTEAKAVTEKALALARQLRADDIIAQSAWELGRLDRQQGNRDLAIAHYTEAVKALQAIRSDLVAVNPDMQFSFRERVEPVYRELVDLLLANTPNQAELVQARSLIEALQVAELDNFFREACLDKTRQIDQVDPTATVIYPIILPDRLAIILSTAGQPLRYYATAKPQADIEQTLSELFTALNPVADAKVRQRLSTQVYDWLIRPAELDHALQNTKTLVFVLDGRLRNIPMSALYDGKQYLIEKYAVTLSPGLQLMATDSLNAGKMGVFVGGISQSRAGFAALPEVEFEVKKIAQAGVTAKLLNQEFTSGAIADRVKNSQANVVHLATHGQFSSRLEDTFLLTWDGRVNIKELSELLKSREGGSSRAIDLLVLSACDTATGDDRAVLGLAGLAIKSGARSTLATLWPVKDKAAAQLMTRFYQQLRQPGHTKAEALRQAQIDLIQNTDFKEPFFWSSFVLVGNWQ
jgi:CHAT domain-containing protein